MALTAATQRWNMCVIVGQVGKGCLLSAAKSSVSNGHGAACCHSEATSLHVAMWYVCEVRMGWVAACCRRLQHALQPACTADKTIDGYATQAKPVCVAAVEHCTT